MKILVQYLVVGGGGAVGAMLRLLVNTVSARSLGASLPFGTFIINISGSLFLGWFLAITGGRIMVSDTLKLAVAVGFVGAYTTFSTFMWESNYLMENLSGMKAMVNLAGSVVAGLLAVRAGIWMGSR
jgi:fluoride exporter